MILAVAATEIEMEPFVVEAAATIPACRTLVTGVGPLETAFRLTKFLCESTEEYAAVIHFGVGGAYLLPDRRNQPKLLDICFAKQEVTGDFGICLGDKMEYLDSALASEIVYDLHAPLAARCQAVLDKLGINYHTGVFITVNGVTGTLARGRMLQARWKAVCENMEGAAVARVCREFNLPSAELRCISNYVEDLNRSAWCLPEAARKAGHTALQLVKGLTK